MSLPVLLCQLLYFRISFFPQLNNKISKNRNYEFCFSLVPISTTTSPFPITTHIPTPAQKSEENKHTEYVSDLLPDLQDNSPESKTGYTANTSSTFMVVFEVSHCIIYYSSFNSWHGTPKKGKGFEIAFQAVFGFCFFHPTGYSLLSQKESSATLSWIISGLPKAL